LGQAEILKYLEKCEKPQTRKQIADGLKEDPIKVSHCLRLLLKWKEIKFIEYDQEEAQKLVAYVLTRRTRFYFI
jgi:hypothetical protein